MKRALVLGALALALGAPAQPAAAPPNEAAAIKATVLQQARLQNEGRFRAMYALFTPKFRANCPFARFAQIALAHRRAWGVGFRVENIRVRFQSPTTALVASRFVRRNGQTIGVATFRTGDVYVKIGPQWYDEYDRVTHCR
jgi:hypothetical protein